MSVCVLYVGAHAFVCVFVCLFCVYVTIHVGARAFVYIIMSLCVYVMVCVYMCVQFLNVHTCENQRVSMLRTVFKMCM